MLRRTYHQSAEPTKESLDSDAASTPTVADMRTSTVGIGEAARCLGTTPRALRHYEALGLLAPTELSSGGHRRYNTSSVARARRILALRALGLPLHDVGSVLDGDNSARTTAILHGQAARLTDEIAKLSTLHERVTAALAISTSQPHPDPDHVPLLDLLEDLAMNIQLTRIYTKTGDDGTTELGGGARVEKQDPRLEVGGDLDELLSAIGLAIAAPDPAHVALLRQIQNDLFDLGARAVTGRNAVNLPPEYTARLEKACDEINALLQPLNSFVLPGGSGYTAAVHFARAVCRRAERHAWASPDIDQEICRYLNRLSDLLFILARSAEPATEATWVPAASSQR